MLNGKVKFYLSLALVGLISACGGGGGSGSPTTVAVPTTAELCYNMTNGNAFRQKQTTSPIQATNLTSTINYNQAVRDVTIQAATYNGVVGQSRVSTGTDTFTPTSLPTVSSKFEVFSNLIAANKYTRVANRNTPVGGASSDTVFSNHMRSLNLAVGASEIYTFTFANAATPTAILGTTTHTVKLLAIEDLVTPAGTFKNACKFSLEVASAGAPPGTSTDIFWYAPGWGNVKEVVTQTFTDGRTPATMTNTTEASLILRGAL